MTSLIENAEEGTRLVFPGDMDMVEDLDKVRVSDNVENVGSWTVWRIWIR